MKLYQCKSVTLIAVAITSSLLLTACSSNTFRNRNLDYLRTDVQQLPPLTTPDGVNAPDAQAWMVVPTGQSSYPAEKKPQVNLAPPTINEPSPVIAPSTPETSPAETQSSNSPAAATTSSKPTPTAAANTAPTASSMKPASAVEPVSKTTTTSASSAAAAITSSAVTSTAAAAASVSTSSPAAQAPKPVSSTAPVAQPSKAVSNAAQATTPAAAVAVSSKPTASKPAATPQTVATTNSKQKSTEVVAPVAVNSTQTSNTQQAAKANPAPAVTTTTTTASASIPAAPVAAKLPALHTSLSFDNNNYGTLIVSAPYSTVWQRVGQAIENSNYYIFDEDASKGFYFIAPRDVPSAGRKLMIALYPPQGQSIQIQVYTMLAEVANSLEANNLLTFINQQLSQ